MHDKCLYTLFLFIYFVYYIGKMRLLYLGSRIKVTASYIFPIRHQNFVVWVVLVYEVNCESVSGVCRHYVPRLSVQSGPNKIQKVYKIVQLRCVQKSRVLTWQSSDYSLNWNVNDDEFKFDNQSNLENANGNYSGSLVCFG